MDKWQERDPEGGPEKDGETNLKIVPLPFDFDYFVQYVDYVCITIVTAT